MGRSLHEFQVLLILGGCAAGCLVHPLTVVHLLVQPREAGESGEELVVTAEAGSGHKAAHGEGVDEPVVEILVGLSHIPGELGRRNQVLVARLLHRLLIRCESEPECFWVNTEALLARIADKSLRIDRAGKVDVQVGALGKASQKGVQTQRPALHSGLVGVGRAGFWLRSAGRGRLGVEGGGCGERKAGERTKWAAHDCFQCSAGMNVWGGFTTPATKWVPAGHRWGPRDCAAGFGVENRSWYTG
jgi:hypothetical protein